MERKGNLGWVPSGLSPIIQPGPRSEIKSVQQVGAEEPRTRREALPCCSLHGDKPRPAPASIHLSVEQRLEQTRPCPRPHELPDWVLLPSSGNLLTPVVHAGVLGRQRRSRAGPCCRAPSRTAKTATSEGVTAASGGVQSRLSSHGVLHRGGKGRVQARGAANPRALWEHSLWS